MLEMVAFFAFLFLFSNALQKKKKENLNAYFFLPICDRNIFDKNWNYDQLMKIIYIKPKIFF